MCWRMVIISGAGKRLSSLLQQHCTFIQKKISSSSSGPTVADLPPRCHGDLTVLSALSKLWWFIDLWLAQLGGKHEKCRSQWQTTSYIKKRWKERADRKKNAVRLKRPTLNAFTVRAVIVCVCVCPLRCLPTGSTHPCCRYVFLESEWLNLRNMSWQWESHGPTVPSWSTWIGEGYQSRNKRKWQRKCAETGYVSSVTLVKVSIERFGILPLFFCLFSWWLFPFIKSEMLKLLNELWTGCYIILISETHNVVTVQRLCLCPPPSVNLSSLFISPLHLLNMQCKWIKLKVIVCGQTERSDTAARCRAS